MIAYKMTHKSVWWWGHENFSTNFVGSRNFFENSVGLRKILTFSRNPPRPGVSILYDRSLKTEFRFQGPKVTLYRRCRHSRRNAATKMVCMPINFYHDVALLVQRGSQGDFPIPRSQGEGHMTPLIPTLHGPDVALRRVKMVLSAPFYFKYILFHFDGKLVVEFNHSKSHIYGVKI